MQIQVDDEARKIVTQLCDLALKAAGLQNLEAVNKLFASMSDLPRDREKKPEAK